MGVIEISAIGSMMMQQALSFGGSGFPVLLSSLAIASAAVLVSLVVPRQWGMSDRLWAARPASALVH